MHGSGRGRVLARVGVCAAKVSLLTLRTGLSGDSLDLVVSSHRLCDY